MDFVRSYFFTNAAFQLPTFFILSSLLGGCNNKATVNPRKSDDRMKKSGQLVRVAFGKEVLVIKYTQYPIIRNGHIRNTSEI